MDPLVAFVTCTAALRLPALALGCHEGQRCRDHHRWAPWLARSAWLSAGTVHPPACLPAAVPDALRALRCAVLQGNVKAVEIVEVEWQPSGNGGPPKFVEKPGTEQVRFVEILAGSIRLLVLGFRL